MIKRPRDLGRKDALDKEREGRETDPQKLFGGQRTGQQSKALREAAPSCTDKTGVLVLKLGTLPAPPPAPALL